jgi:hypothetical protein
MKALNYLLLAATLLFVSCKNNEKTVTFPELTSLENTQWYSYDSSANIFYDIYYLESGKGVMLGYSEQARENEVVNRPFDYSFTPATDSIDAIVMVDFEDGQHYGGHLIPKGNIQINLQDVYMIELFEVDANGDVIYNVDGEIKARLLMWNDEPQITDAIE